MRKRTVNTPRLTVKRMAAALALVTVAGTAALTGCGSTDTSARAGTESSDEVTKVIIGSGNAYNPYCYVDESGTAVGYEYDVLAKIDELLPQYEFEYQTMAFDQILLSLDSGKIDLAAHQYEYTDERAEKYLFSEETYTSYITYVAVLLDDDAKSLEDLAGEKIRAGGSTSATTQILTKWNEDHPGKEVIIYNSEGSTDEEAAAAIKSGATRAAVMKKSDLKKYNDNFSDDGKEWLKFIGEPINNSQTYYVYRKDETELQKAVDGALKKLKEDGTLSELAIKWVGYDVTEEE